MSEEGNEGNTTIKKRIQLTPSKDLEVEVELDPELVKAKKFLDKRAKAMAEELTELGVPTDSSEINVDNLKSTYDTIVELRKRNKQAELQASRDADPTRKPSSGSLPLTGQITGGEYGYESHQALVRDLRRRSHSKNPETSREAKLILDEIWRKTIIGKKEKDFQMDTFKDEGEGLLEKFKREWRKRQKERD